MAFRKMLLGFAALATGFPAPAGAQELVEIEVRQDPVEAEWRACYRDDLSQIEVVRVVGRREPMAQESEMLVEVELWDLATGRRIETTAEALRLGTCRLTPDGRYLLDFRRDLESTRSNRPEDARWDVTAYELPSLRRRRTLQLPFGAYSGFLPPGVVRRPCLGSTECRVVEIDAGLSTSWLQTSSFRSVGTLEHDIRRPGVSPVLQKVVATHGPTGRFAYTRGEPSHPRSLFLSEAGDRGEGNEVDLSVPLLDYVRPGSTQPAEHVEFCHDGAVLCYLVNQRLLWIDVRRRRETANIDLGTLGEIGSIFPTCDGEACWIGTEGGALLISSADGSVLRRVGEIPELAGVPCTTLPTPDGRFVILADGARVYAFDSARGSRTATIGRVVPQRTSPDGTVGVLWTERWIQAWEMFPLRHRASASASASIPNWVREGPWVSTDGARLVVAANERVRQIGLSTGAVESDWALERRQILAVAPDGRSVLVRGAPAAGTATAVQRVDLANQAVLWEAADVATGDRVAISEDGARWVQLTAGSPPRVLWRSWPSGAAEAAVDLPDEAAPSDQGLGPTFPPPLACSREGTLAAFPARGGVALVRSDGRVQVALLSGDSHLVEAEAAPIDGALFLVTTEPTSLLAKTVHLVRGDETELRRGHVLSVLARYEDWNSSHETRLEGGGWVRVATPDGSWWIRLGVRP